MPPAGAAPSAADTTAVHGRDPQTAAASAICRISRPGARRAPGCTGSDQPVSSGGLTARRLGSRGGGLEQLDYVAGGVLGQDLLPAGAGEDLVAEAHPL